jgi:pimeloyl-ACP methyl ester carboxylesterase
MTIAAEEHWVKKGPVKLYVYRKRDTAKAGPRPVLFLVHGSTFSSRGTYDLIVPGRSGYSAMEHFAGLGYDVWTMDHEGYGYSDRTSSNSGIDVGVEDLEAAMPLVLEKTGARSVLMFGESSGSIKAGAYAQANPGTVERLVMHAHTHTGTNAPEIERRRKIVDQFRNNPKRPFGMQQVTHIFERDVKGSGDPVVIEALADFELKFGSEVPSGTYLDMATRMPMVDPRKLTCAVCVIRPDHDGNASDAELYQFFADLPTRDKQFIMVKGLTHGGAMVGSQRHRVWHIVHGFMSLPPLPT